MEIDCENAKKDPNWNKYIEWARKFIKQVEKEDPDNFTKEYINNIAEFLKIFRESD